jgi:hypothetical protein
MPANADQEGEGLRFRHLVVNIVAAIVLSGAAHAQTTPTASKLLGLSTFGGITGTYTGLSGGRNLGITAGVDIGTGFSYRGFRPYIEGRGTYPLDGGHIDAQKDVLGGVRMERLLRPSLGVYGDFLFGRGEIDYENGGYPALSGNYLYLRSTSNVVSPGAGAEYRLTKNFSGLADVQFQHWDTPATPSGHLWAKAITLGVRYRFDFNRRGYPSAP